MISNDFTVDADRQATLRTEELQLHRSVIFAVAIAFGLVVYVYSLMPSCNLVLVIV